MAGILDTIMEALVRRLINGLDRPEAAPPLASRPLPDISHFPFELIEVPGAQAVAEWEHIRTRPGITPVIVGTTEDDLESLAWPFQPDSGFPPDDISAVLAEADGIDFPTRILTLEDEITADMIAAAKKNGDEALFELLESAGDDEDWRDAVFNAPWPDRSDVYAQTGPIGLQNWKTGQIEKSLLIALVPTEDPTELPAFLSWGGWNANPMPAWHVAAFRSWADRYGAIPVVMRRDVIEFRVARRPETRDEATALATEMYAYCGDIVDQGVGTVPVLAATLMVSDWWYFWWD